MIQHQDIDRIIEQAKQQRAEHIAAGIKKNMIPIAATAMLSLVLLQFAWDGTPQEVADSPLATRVIV